MPFDNQLFICWERLYELSLKPAKRENPFGVRNRLRALEKARRELNMAILVCGESGIMVSLPRLGPGKGVGPADLGIKV